MSSTVLTFIIAFALILIALTLLGVGYLITGKPGFELRRCGRDPTKKQGKDSGCDTGPVCTICGKTDKDEEPKEPENEE